MVFCAILIIKEGEAIKILLFFYKHSGFPPALKGGEAGGRKFVDKEFSLSVKLR